MFMWICSGVIFVHIILIPRNFVRYLKRINFREDLFSRRLIFAWTNFRDWHFQIFRVGLIFANAEYRKISRGLIFANAKITTNIFF